MVAKTSDAIILEAIHEVMDAVPYVQKKGRNEFHKYTYASEGDLLKVLRPAMVKAGLMPIPSVLEVSDIDQYGNTHVKVEYTMTHVSGAIWPQKIIAYGCGNDRNSKGGVGDKGLYKALTGANKYFLFKVFQIETGDDPEKTESDAAPADGDAKKVLVQTATNKAKEKATSAVNHATKGMPPTDIISVQLIPDTNNVDWPAWDKAMSERAASITDSQMFIAFEGQHASALLNFKRADLAAHDKLQEYFADRLREIQKAG